MFREVGREISGQGLKLSRPGTQPYVCLLLSVRSIHVCIRSKAVADGAISYYLDHFVVGRLIRYTYGTPATVGYDHSDPDHRRHSRKKYLGITGEMQIDVFSPSLFKVNVLASGGNAQWN